MIKVFIADDHKLFRDGLTSLLVKSNEIKIVGEASSGQETVDKILKLEPDVALIDITMPELNGIEVIKRIKKYKPKIKILIITMHADPYFVTNSFKAGALGYLLKEDSFESLIDAIKMVSLGKKFISPSLEPMISSCELHSINKKKEKENILSPREIEILQLIAEGYTNQKIAEKLCISVRTVDTHRKKIMIKLGIHNTAGLVKYAIKHKIISL